MDGPEIVRTFARLARRPPKFTDYLGEKVQAPPITLGSAIAAIVGFAVIALVSKVLPLPGWSVLVGGLLIGAAYYALQELQLGSPQLYGQGGLIRLRSRVERLTSRYRRVPRPRGFTRRGPA